MCRNEFRQECLDITSIIQNYCTLLLVLINAMIKKFENINVLLNLLSKNRFSKIHQQL